MNALHMDSGQFSRSTYSRTTTDEIKLQPYPVITERITLELEESYAKVARSNIDRAGGSHLVDVRVGQALDSLPLIEAEQLGPFDLIFIDADKPNNPEYLQWALRLFKTGHLHYRR